MDNIHAHSTNDTVTIVFTDIEGYSTLEERYGAGLQSALEEHFRIFRDAYTQSQGEGKTELRVIGDAFFYTFEQPSHAVVFALETQRQLREYSWRAQSAGGEWEPIEIRVRVGIHIGEVRAIVHQNTGQHDIFGTAVNKAARISAAGHGGQVLVSEAVRRMAQEQILPSEISFLNHGEHRLKGVGQEHIWQLAHPDLPIDFPPLNTLDAQKHNLPLQATPFVGRESELEEWKRQLCLPATRLMTLTAFGGMGKTRLALQIAEEICGKFEHGVWWVPLENARNGDEMVQRIADVLIQNLKPQPTVRDQLWEFHRDRELLLVLDNLEQINHDDVSEVLQNILAAGPGIKVLATSRSSTGMPGEQLKELEPFEPSQAEQLFVERAQARKTNFVLNSDNAADVAAICRHLEGMPLAIEIAASRITLMSPRQMLPFLQKQLAEMQTVDPTAPGRQKALSAAVEWSFNLLSEPGQSLFSQLSVFAGGFYMESAIAVTCHSPQDTASQTDECRGFKDHEIINGLMELRSQSLLRAHTDAATQLERLSMLESVRDYAQKKLPDDAIRKRHAEYFCKWASQQSEHLRTSNEADMVTAFEIEFDNLRSAFLWAKANDALLCARLATVFYESLNTLGHAEEARNYLRDGWSAIASLPATPGVLQVRGTLRYALAGLLDDIGEKAAAQALAHQSLEFYQQAKDRIGAANTFNLLAVLATGNHQWEDSLGHCESALELWPPQDLVGRGKTLHNRARAAQGAGDLSQARQSYQEALQLRRKAGDEHGAAKTLSNLGTLAQSEDDLEGAQKFYAQSLQFWRKLGHRCNVAVTLNNLGEIAMLQGDNQRALVLLLHAQRVFEELKSPFVCEPVQTLEKIKAHTGNAEYERLYAAAADQAWENFV